ncbi:MAG: inverse autotransporter beta domain-containing protein [Deltaproteobacteria bacterium]|nr:inverse autotransporter beta domain-containing protein [Deltaproteobacteria bacterium]
MLAIQRVLLIVILAVLLVFGGRLAEAGESRVWQAFDRPAVLLLSGLQGCAPTLRDDASEVSRCLAGWSINELLLDAMTRLATERGQAIFGRNFRIVNNLSHSPAGSGLRGGLDVVLPFGSSTLSGAARPESSAFFLQNGLTRWVDERGSSRNDYRAGAVRRFDLSGQGALSGILGVSAFMQQSREYQHTRLVVGADYGGKWGRGTINMFMPATGWRPTHTGYEERALAGTELVLQFNLTTTLSMKTALARWEDEDGLGEWSTKGRVAVEWRPHRWFNIGASWSDSGTHHDSHEFRLAFSMPLGDMRQPQWEGMGAVGGGPTPSSLDAWSPVANVGAIQVATRKRARVDPVSEATVRFLQESATTGDQISLEVRLSAVTSRDLDFVVTLAPGTGTNPAVPGVDYFDEPIPVTIPAGTSSAAVIIQLPLNAELNESRSLMATVTAAS